MTDEFLPAALLAIQLVEPGDEFHADGEWHEVFTVESSNYGLMIHTSDDRVFLADPMHSRRVRKLRPPVPTVST